MKLNRILGIITVVLFVLSFMAYRSSQAQAERFERGQKFLPNLNPDNIAEIALDKGKDHVILKREDDHFKLVSKNGYPAKNQAVNRLITSVLDIDLNSEVGSDEGLAKELETTEGFEGSAHIVFKDSAGKEMVNFFVGKNTKEGQGSYVRKVGPGSMAYLTSKSIYLTTTPSSFLQEEVLNVAETEISRIEGNGIVLSEKDGTLELDNVPAKMETKSSELGQLKGILANLKISDAFLADDPSVHDLNFGAGFKVYLKDLTHYQISAARKDSKMYLKVEGGHQLKQIQLTGQESEEEMKEKSKVLQRADEIKKFNDFHGSWIYEVSEYAGKKFFFTQKDLIQEKESK